MQPRRGDVVRSSDPFKLGANSQRPWLIVNNDSHPFGDEQYIAVAITTKQYADSIDSLTARFARGSFVIPQRDALSRVSNGNLHWQKLRAKRAVCMKE